jgi:hypothetical protein
LLGQFTLGSGPAHGAAPAIASHAPGQRRALASSTKKW